MLRRFSRQDRNILNVSTTTSKFWNAYSQKFVALLPACTLNSPTFFLEEMVTRVGQRLVDLVFYFRQNIYSLRAVQLKRLVRRNAMRYVHIILCLLYRNLHIEEPANAFKKKITQVSYRLRFLVDYWRVNMHAVFEERPCQLIDVLAYIDSLDYVHMELCRICAYLRIEDVQSGLEYRVLLASDRLDDLAYYFRMYIYAPCSNHTQISAERRFSARRDGNWFNRCIHTHPGSRTWFGNNDDRNKRSLGHIGALSSY